MKLFFAALVMGLLLYCLFVLAADGISGSYDGQNAVLMLSSLQFILPATIFLALIFIQNTVTFWNHTSATQLPNLFYKTRTALLPFAIVAVLFAFDWLVPSSRDAAAMYADLLFSLQGETDGEVYDAFASMSFIQQSWVGIVLCAGLASLAYFAYVRLVVHRLRNLWPPKAAM